MLGYDEMKRWRHGSSAKAPEQAFACPPFPLPLFIIPTLPKTSQSLLIWKNNQPPPGEGGGLRSATLKSNGKLSTNRNVKNMSSFIFNAFGGSGGEGVRAKVQSPTHTGGLWLMLYDWKLIGTERKTGFKTERFKTTKLCQSAGEVGGRGAPVNRIGSGASMTGAGAGEKGTGDREGAAVDGGEGTQCDGQSVRRPPPPTPPLRCRRDPMAHGSGLLEGGRRSPRPGVL